ncbi:MAG TPA: HEPN domain-containing protein [Acidimicrobiales bacterium]
MTALSEARAHRRKAREFLHAAEIELDCDLFNAATSSAVTSGINAKDAICLALTGKTAKTDNHAGAIAELRRAGTATKSLATTLGRLLKLKNRAQYPTVDVARADTVKAVGWATTLVEGASEIVPK